MHTAVQSEVTAAAVQESISVLEAFAAGGPTADELSRVRDYLSGIFPLRMETTSQLASRLAELIVHDLPEDYHHTYRDRLRAVGLDHVRSAVEAHLRPERIMILVVGDADRVTSDLEALQLGPVEVAVPLE